MRYCTLLSLLASALNAEVFTFNAPQKGSVEVIASGLTINPSGGSKRRPAPIGVTISAQSMSKSCSYNALELTISVSGEWEIDRSPGMAEFRFRLTSRISDVTPSVFDIPLPESFRTLRAAETRLKVHGGTFDCSWTYIDVPFTSTAHSTLSRGLEPGTDCELDTGVDSVVLAQTVSTHADYYRAKAVRDEFGVKELTDTQRVFTIGRDSKMRVLALDLEKARAFYALGGQEFSGRILAYRNCMSKSLKGNLEDPFQPGCVEPVHSPDIRGYQVRSYAEVRVLSGPHVGKKGWTSLIFLVPSLIAKALDQ